MQLAMGAAKLRTKRFIKANGLLEFVTNFCLRVFFRLFSTPYRLPKREAAHEQL